MLGKWWRLGGLLGIAFIRVLAAQDGGNRDETAVRRRTRSARSARTGEDDGQRYLMVQYLALLAMTILFLPYMVALTTMLGRAGERTLWSRVSLAGGVCFVAVTMTPTRSGRPWQSEPTRSATTGCEKPLMYLDAAAFYISVFPSPRRS